MGTLPGLFLFKQSLLPRQPPPSRSSEIYNKSDAAATSEDSPKDSHGVVSPLLFSLSLSRLLPIGSLRLAERGRGGGIDASFASFETKSISATSKVSLERVRSFVRWTNSHEKPLIVDPPRRPFFSSLFPSFLFLLFQRTFSDRLVPCRRVITTTPPKGIERVRQRGREEYNARGLIRERFEP